MAAAVSIAPWADPVLPLPEDSAFFRLWRGFGTARVAIAAVLLAMLAAMFAMRAPAPVNAWLLGLCGTYFAATLVVRLLMQPVPPGRGMHPQWVATIVVDLVVFSTLQYLQAGGLSFSPLFAVPVLMASVLGSALLAFGTAAAVTLLLLADAWLAAQLSEANARYLQAGLTGSGYFALAFLANQLAVRLAREEKRAHLSQKAAQIQSRVNELVIKTLSDGVLVVDATGLAHAANPAARAILGAADVRGGRPLALTAEAAWLPLLDLAQLTLQTEAPQQAEVPMAVPGGAVRQVFVRTRIAAPGNGPADSLCLMFLEDLREMQARLRTEKLAAMGRMSAAVAHEIRNPLAAITQANALLDEDLTDPAQRQLSGLVSQNAQRLRQIVEDILDVARVRQEPSAAPPVLLLDAATAATCQDWAAQTGNASRLQMALRAGPVRVPFESGHLRRVLVNLLDNASRYASQRADAIQIATAAGGPQAGLVVWSDGAPLDATVQRHLFEPFFSSESRSSGLGLYICRELCERHGALIGYRRCIGPGGEPREGNEFFVSFGSSAASAAAAAPARIPA